MSLREGRLGLGRENFMGAVRQVVPAVQTREVCSSATSNGRITFPALAISVPALPNPAHVSSSNGGRFYSAPETVPSLVVDWIRLICQAWSRGPQSVLELAHLMNKARRRLPYGGWSRLWESSELPFSKRKGEKLVVIGQGLEGLDANNCSHLPAAWNTLYWLARLGRAVVERLIRDGRIHPGLSLREARSLLAEYQPATSQKTGSSKLESRFARFAAFVGADLPNWSTQERQWAARQLQILENQIQQAEDPLDHESPDAISIL